MMNAIAPEEEAEEGKRQWEGVGVEDWEGRRSGGERGGGWKRRR